MCQAEVTHVRRVGKDEVFYGAFRELAAAALDAAGKTVALLEDLASAPTAARPIAEARRSGQAVVRRAMRELHSIWITPIDRHHIHELIAGLDGVLALVDSTAARMVLFGMRETRAELPDLARQVCEACKRLREVTDLLPKLSKGNAAEVMRLVGEIHEVAAKADETHRRALASLFDGSSDPLMVMKWREVLDNLEKATNLCRAVAELFEAIVLENA
jgi:uncharacterized protein Yka (UPF0111/DUF47 family)